MRAGWPGALHPELTGQSLHCVFIRRQGEVGDPLLSGLDHFLRLDELRQQSGTALTRQADSLGNLTTPGLILALQEVEHLDLKALALSLLLSGLAVNRGPLFHLGA